MPLNLPVPPEVVRAVQLRGEHPEELVELTLEEVDRLAETGQWPVCLDSLVSDRVTSPASEPSASAAAPRRRAQ